MNLTRQKFITDTIYSALPLIASPLSGLVIMIFITKAMGTVGYGIWAQFQVTFSLLAFFLCMSFGRAIPRFLSGDKSKEYLSKVFYSALSLIFAITAVAGLIIFFFKDFLADFLFGQESLASVIILLIIFLLLRNMNRQGQHILIAQRHIKAWSLINVAMFIITALTVSLAAIITQSITVALSAFVIVEAVIFVILISVIWSKGIVPAKPAFSFVAPLLRFGIPLIITGAGYWIIQSSDRYLIKYFIDISSVGLYSVSYSTAFALMFFWTTLRSVLLPDLAVLFDEKRTDELETRFSRVLKYGVALTFPAVVGSFILANPIIRFLSSAEFLPAANILMIISIAVFFYGIFMHFNTLMDILKKVRFLTFLWIFMAVLNLGLNFILIPKLGIEGAAYSTLLTFLIGAVIIIAKSLKHFKIIFKTEWAMKIIGASLLMGIAVKCVSVSSNQLLFLAIFIGVLTYGLMLYLLKFCDKSEILLFKKINPIR